MNDRDFEADIDKAMTYCRRCQNSTPAAREAHRRRSLEQILTVQTRRPYKLPAYVWADGKAPR